MLLIPSRIITGMANYVPIGVFLIEMPNVFALSRQILEMVPDTSRVDILKYQCAVAHG